MFIMYVRAYLSLQRNTHEVPFIIPLETYVEYGISNKLAYFRQDVTGGG